MSLKSLLMLLTATAVLVAGAVLLHARRAPAQGPTLPDAVLEGLDVNAVAGVRIEKAAASLALARQADGGWAVADLGDYPARVEDIKQLLLTLAGMEPLERKTARDDRYASLGVEGPTTGSESTRVTLLDAQGAELAAVVVGDSSFLGSTQGTFVRVGPQAWLIEGAINAPDDPLRWVDRAVLRVPVERLAAIRVTHPDGEIVELVRQGTSPGDPFTAPAPPPGRTAAEAATIAGFINALTYVGLESARPASEPPAEAVRTDYELADGSRIIAHTWEEAATFWAVFHAEPAPADSSADAPAEPEQPEQEPAVFPSAPELLGERSAWAFALAASKAERLRPRWADVTTEATTEEFLGPLGDPEAAPDEPLDGTDPAPPG